MQFTRPATWDDVKTLARYLNETGADYALVGGYAIAAHGFNRFTEDIDLLVDPSADNARRWILALSRLPDGAARELSMAGSVFAKDNLYAVRINDEITVDVMPGVCGQSWEALRSHVITIDVEGQPIKVLDLPGLLKTKQGLRPKDQMDAAVIAPALAAIATK
jgi:hypothetical protein